MDLPACPACGQSVLDDDVDDCPFCGASMTGKPAKPGKQPAPPKAQPKAGEKPVEKKVPAEKPVTKSEAPPAKSGAVAKQETQDDDPFAVDKTEPKQVVRLHNKPTKGRSHKVVCPMCDTVGFTSRKAAGREVRCPNPDCALPIFTAPEIEKKEEPVEEESASSKTSLVLIGAILGVVLVLASGGWYFFFGNQPSPKPNGSSGIEITGEEQIVPFGEEESGNTKNSKNAGKQKSAPVVKTFDPADVRKEMLTRMVDFSLRMEQARKPLSIRITAESLAQVGDAESARKQLKRLEVLGSDLSHYKIHALSQLAWNELDANRPENANKILDEAVSAAEKLGTLGQDPIDTATILATALAAVDRADEAKRLIQKHSPKGATGQLSATLQMMKQLKSYDLDKLISNQPLSPAKAPQWVAVTSGLAARKRWDDSLKWAEIPLDLEVRTDSVILWAEMFTQNALKNKQADWLIRVQTPAEKLTPSGQARLWARVAGRQLAGADKDGAEQSLKNSYDILDPIGVPDPFVLPGSTELYRLGLQRSESLALPDPAPLRMAALAAAEMARIESQLGRKEQAWKSMQRALQFARGMAPSVIAIQNRLDAASDRAGAVRSRIRQLLNLDNNAKTRLVFNKYVKQCEKIQQSAQQRHELLTTLLAGAAEWNLLDEVWNEIKTRSEQQDLNEQERYHSTPVPVILYNRFSAAGTKDQAGEINKILAAANITPHAEENVKQRTSQMIAANGDVRKVANLLEKARIERSFKELWTMQLASRLVKAGKLNSAVRLARAVDDPILRENTFTLIAAQATVNGQGEAIWKLLQDQSRHPMEWIAIGHGFVSGSLNLIPQPAAEKRDDQAAEK